MNRVLAVAAIMTGGCREPARQVEPVYAIDRGTGKPTLVREYLPWQIVGAGVSTCAPLVEREP